MALSTTPLRRARALHTSLVVIRTFADSFHRRAPSSTLRTLRSVRSMSTYNSDPPSDNIGLRRASRSDYPVFGLAVDLGNIQSTQSPVVWTVGFVRDPSIQYTTGSGTVQNRSPYYVTEYSNVVDAVGLYPLSQNGVS